MPLTRWQIKERLPHGAGRKIAKLTRRSESMVSRVITGQRRDGIVEMAIAHEIGLPVDMVFPPRTQEPEESAA